LPRYVDRLHDMDLGAIDIGDICKQNELQRQVNNLLNAGLIIILSNSAYASPEFSVNNTHKSKRSVIDYRQINKQVPQQNFPIKIIQKVFGCLEESKYFNIIDM
jgi:hypothetical protein